jgi:endonuclease/exonuclease/phosphatase family metal-dependent hydrolase
MGEKRVIDADSVDILAKLLTSKATEASALRNRAGALQAGDRVTGLVPVITWAEQAARELHAAAQVARRDGSTVRLFNLNIGQGAGNGPFNGKGTEPHEIMKIAELIAKGDADVATLQEVFKKDTDLLEQALEKLTGDDWTIYFGEASKKVQWDGASASVNEPFGNAIAVRRGSGVLSSEVTGGPIKLDAPGDDGTEGRSMMGVRVHTSSGPLDIYTTHVAEDKPEMDRQQTAQINRVWDGLATKGDRVVVTGDFNETLDGADASAQALRRHGEFGYADGGNAGKTSVNGTGRRIDYVFTGPGIDARSPLPVDGRPSDHNGMVVDIQVPRLGQ